MEIGYDVGYDDEFYYDCDLNKFLDSLGKRELSKYLFELVDEDFVEEWDLPDDEEAFVDKLSEDDDLRQEVTNTLLDALTDYLDDEIREFFHDEAMEAYKDYKEFKRDPYAYNGVRRTDFA